MGPKGLPNKAILPSGAKDILIEASAMISHIERRVSGVFEQWGYKRIITSFLEYEDVLLKGVDREITRGLLKFVEQSSGRVIAIRSDITPQIARVVATRLKDFAEPLRLYYNESVLRSSTHPPYKVEEVFQVGAELVGVELPEADAEIITMAIESLRSLGLKEFKVNIGHVGFLKGVMNGLSIGEEDRAFLMKAIALKDRTQLLEILSDISISNAYKNLLFTLPTLCGGNEVVEKGLSLTKGMEAQKSLENMASVLRFLSLYNVKEFVTVDLGEARGFNYYTGIIFEGFVKGIGKGIVKGGRYDDLLSRYGYQTPAVGFALDMEEVMYAVEAGNIMERKESTNLLIFDSREEKGEALRVASLLREKGFSVVMDIISKDYEASINYCRRNKIDLILHMGSKDIGNDKVIIEDVKTGKRFKEKIKDVLDGMVFSSKI